MTHYADKQQLFPMQGGCACGHVRYQLALPPLLVHCCHCTACQRQTGSAFAINVIVESSAVTLLPSSTSTIPGSKASPATTSTAAMPAFQELMASSVNLSDPGSASGLAMTVLPSSSGVGTTLARCPLCQTGLWMHYADGGPHITYLRAGTLDLPWELEPDAHIYVRSRRDFVTISDGKPQFEDYYPDREAMYRPETKERVQALKAKQDEWKAGLIWAINKP